jgi:hypothetical protein
MSTTGEAQIKVEEFEKKSSATDWIKIKKDQLVDGMKKRLKDPNLISTKVVNLCGPGALFRCLAADDPVMYVQAIINLYETNSALLGSRKFTASHSLRIADPAKGMDHVDWMLLASLRDHENTLLNYDDAGGGLSGLTMPSGLAKWFKEAKYTGITNDTNIFFTKGLDHIKKAGTLHAAGNRVCLLIDANMLKVTTQNNLSTYPDHWVVLMNNVTVDASNNVSLKVHSWGKIMPVPELGTVSASVFCKNYYGYVVAKPPA